MGNKIRAAIIGPGNIGTNLLMKVHRSESIDFWRAWHDDSQQPEG